MHKKIILKKKNNDFSSNGLYGPKILKKAA